MIGSTYLPSNIELVIAHKVRVVALEGVEDKALVRLRDELIGETPFVREVHLDRHRVRIEAGRLRVELEVDGLAGLDADDELVTRDILENALRHVLVLYPDFYLCLVESYHGYVSFSALASTAVSLEHTFASFQDEWHTLPPRVVDPERRSGERRANRIMRNRLIVEVARLPVRGDILAQQRVFTCNWWDRTKNFHLKQKWGGELAFLVG